MHPRASIQSILLTFVSILPTYEEFQITSCFENNLNIRRTSKQLKILVTLQHQIYV